MNKLITILLFCCSTANAQHLKFMGLPVNCTFTDFFSEMLRRDYLPYSDDNYKDLCYTSFNGGCFHEQPYSITFKVDENNNVEGIYLSVEFDNLTDAIAEYNEIVKGTEEKHSEYHRVTYTPDKSSFGEQLSFRPTGNPDETLTVSYWNLETSKPSVSINYQIHKQHNKSDDL